MLQDHARNAVNAVTNTPKIDPAKAAHIPVPNVANISILSTIKPTNIPEPPKPKKDKERERKREKRKGALSKSHKRRG